MAQKDGKAAKMGNGHPPIPPGPDGSKSTEQVTPFLPGLLYYIAGVSTAIFLLMLYYIIFCGCCCK